LSANGFLETWSFASSIAVYVENGGWGATYGVPVGALMMEQYINGKLSPENELRAEEISNRVILYGNEER
jgi:penicillin-binding protein 2